MAFIMMMINRVMIKGMNIDDKIQIKLSGTSGKINLPRAGNKIK